MLLKRALDTWRENVITGYYWRAHLLSFKTSPCQITPVGSCEEVVKKFKVGITAGVIGWISDSYCSLKPLCSGMGEEVPARTSPTLLPPSPRTVLSLSCFKVSQCINCRD